MKKYLKNMLKIISGLIFILIATGLLFMKYKTDNNPIPVESKNKQEENRVLPGGFSHGVWEWDGPTDSARSNIKLLSDKGFKIIFLNMNNLIDITEITDEQEKQEKEQVLFGNLDKYLEESSSKNIKVHAVFGGPQWGKPSHRYLLTLSYDLVKKYNAVHSIGFLGIQFDIEPQNLSSFESNKELELRYYLESIDILTKNIMEKEDQNSLVLGLAIPYWYDGENENIPKISVESESKYPFFHIANRLNRLKESYIALMAYRNESEGKDGSINISKSEVLFLNENTKNVKIFVGQETGDELPSKITFYGKTYPEFIDSVEEICGIFGQYENYYGIAVNDVASFNNLTKK